MRCGAAAASSARQRSSFFTGCFVTVFQPRASSVGSHLVMPSRRYEESVKNSTSHGSLSALERADGSLEFHAVVRRRRLAAAEFLAVSAVFEHRRPAAGPGIALAAAVGVNGDASSNRVHAHDSAPRACLIQLQHVAGLQARARLSDR